MTCPLISIVIPSLNQAEYLDAALRSVVEQDYPRIELIVMDGGSTDGSTDVIRNYAPRISYWTSRADGGAASALNEGFRHATGEILGVLNADDFYLPGALAAIAVAFGSNGQTDVISGHGYFTTPNGELGPPMFSDRWNLRRFRYGACVLMQPATFFRRTAYERTSGFRESGRVCWDMELWAELAAAGATFGTIDRPLAAFRLHSGSITGGTDHQRARRQHARAVMAELRARPEAVSDRFGHLLFRVIKFAEHPVRSLRQRWFVHSTLHRWSL